MPPRSLEILEQAPELPLPIRFSRMPTPIAQFLPCSPRDQPYITRGIKEKMRTNFLIIILFYSIRSLSQTSNVTATITDSDGQTWNNGNVQVTFIPTPGIPGPFTWSGGNPF